MLQLRCGLDETISLNMLFRSFHIENFIQKFAYRSQCRAFQGSTSGSPSNSPRFSSRNPPPIEEQVDKVRSTHSSGHKYQQGTFWYSLKSILNSLDSMVGISWSWPQSVRSCIHLELRASSRLARLGGTSSGAGYGRSPIIAARNTGIWRCLPIR